MRSALRLSHSRARSASSSAGTATLSPSSEGSARSERLAASTVPSAIPRTGRGRPRRGVATRATVAAAAGDEQTATTYSAATPWTAASRVARSGSAATITVGIAARPRRAGPDQGHGLGIQGEHHGDLQEGLLP